MAGLTEQAFLDTYVKDDEGRWVVKGADTSRKGISEEAWAKAVAGLIKRYVADALKPLQEQIERQANLVDPLISLADRLDALEARQEKSLADSFKGPWLPRAGYTRGALVQHQGSIWIALYDVEGKPGEAEGWRLLVRGK